MVIPTVKIENIIKIDRKIRSANEALPLFIISVLHQNNEMHAVSAY